MSQKEETQERMHNNDPPATEDHYHVVCNNGSHQCSNVVMQQIASVEEREIYMLTWRRKDDKWTRIINVSYDARKHPSKSMLPSSLSGIWKGW
jgi:hypothetical protein